MHTLLPYVCVLVNVLGFVAHDFWNRSAPQRATLSKGWDKIQFQQPGWFNLVECTFPKYTDVVRKLSPAEFDLDDLDKSDARFRSEGYYFKVCTYYIF